MRLFGFLLKLLMVVALVLWLADQPGTAHIIWHDYVIETSAAFLGLCVLGVAIAFVFAYRLWRLVTVGPRLSRLRRTIKKLENGQDAITHGLVAIAAGDAAEAGKQAVMARKLLGVTTATQLLQAQAAQLSGDHGFAKEIFLSLASDSESAVLGYRGLIMECIREKNWGEAERQIEKLRRLKPETPWLSLIQFEMATRRGLWRDASAALTIAASAHLVDTPQARKHQAALLMAASDVESKQGQPVSALQTVEQAARQTPEWLPVLIMLAQKQIDTDHKRAALRTIERAWGICPHPQLAKMMGDMGGTHNVLDRYKQIEKLVRHNADDAASHLALAEAALAADLWGEARRHLIMVVSRKNATQKAFRLLARLERRESGDEQGAMQWLIKAAEALPDPRWLCTTCGGSHDAWQSICQHCGAFNAMEWLIPGVSRHEGRAGLIATALDVPLG